MKDIDRGGMGQYPAPDFSDVPTAEELAARKAAAETPVVSLGGGLGITTDLAQSSDGREVLQPNN